MDTAVVSAASPLFQGDDSGDERDEMQVDTKGKKQALEYVERPHDFPGIVNPDAIAQIKESSLPVMETAVFSVASLFHGDDSDDDRDEMQMDTEGNKQALEYVERSHDFPGMKLCVREFSCHELNANLLWPGTFKFATWLVNNQSVLDGQRILELGSGTGALAIFLRKAFGVDITTSDYDDKEIEENIAYNCRANSLDVLPHIRHTWGDPFPVSRPDWDIVIASDILLYVKQYENLVKTLSFVLKEYKQNGQKAGRITITDKSGTQVPAKTPIFLMSWRRRIGKDISLFFNGCEKAGLQVQHLGDLVYLISIRN